MKWWPPSEWSVWKRIHGIFDYHPPSLYERRPFGKSINDIPPGAIMLFSSKSPNWYQRLIQGATESRQEHAGTYFGSGRHEIVEATATGIRANSLNDRFKDPDVMIWVYVYKPMTVQQLQVIKAYNYGAIGKPYDYIGILDFVLGGSNKSQATAFCSKQTVLGFLQPTPSIMTSNKAPERTAPGDIQRFMEIRLQDHNPAWELWDIQNVKQAG